MTTSAEKVLADLRRRTDEAARAVLAHLEASGTIARLTPDTVEAAVARAVDVLAADLQRGNAGTSLLAQRIGPIHTVDELCGRLVAPGERPLTGEAVRKRVHSRRLIAFLTDDRHWAFPDWQFDTVAGRLVANSDIVAAWQDLPHEGFLTDADLAAWMNTTFGVLPEGTPAATARRHGANDPALAEAIGRLTQRAA